MSAVTIVLGRDGMGSEADEADFDAWVAYVERRIPELTSVDVTVEERGSRDVQEDAIRVDDTIDASDVRSVLTRLWEDFCGDDSAWPARAAQ